MMTPKKLAEIWYAHAALGALAPPEIRPVFAWWKRAYIYVVFKINPPRSS